MMFRSAILLSALLFLSLPAYADFPLTTNQLGEPGERGWNGCEGYAGPAGLGGVPSGTASLRDGTNGGTGGRGGTGGTGGQGGIGRWDIWASFAYANSSTIYVGGVYGSTGDVGAQGSSGSSGGGGGFANWPGFMPGEDGSGWYGGDGSAITGTPGGNGTANGGGGGGGSCGPNGFVQEMSNGGNGHGESGGAGYNGSTGDRGSSQSADITSNTYLGGDLYLGGNGGNGGPGGIGGCGGGGGGGAGGGGNWYAGVGGSGGSGYSGGSGGAGGPPGGGMFIIQEDGGFFSSSGTTYIRSNGLLDIYGIYQVYWEGSIINYNRLWVSGGILANYETITNHSDFTNSGNVINFGTIDGDLISSGFYTGEGVLNGTLTSTGVVAPGYEENPGITTIENLITPDGMIQITLTGHDPEAYDQLEVTGALILNGATLQPEFQDGFDENFMTQGDSFDVIKYRTIISDEFSEIDGTLAPLAQSEWTVEYNHDLGEGWYSIRLVYGSDLSAAEGSDLPVVYSLDGAYPNPFNPMTTVRYSLPEAGPVVFRIYDLSGRQVWSRQEHAMPAGRHDFVWRGTDSRGQSLASGSYLLRMKATGYEASKKMMLVR